MQAIAGAGRVQCTGLALARCRGGRVPPLPLPPRRRQPDNRFEAAASLSHSLLLQRQQHDRVCRPAAAAAADATPTASADEDPSTAFDWQLGLALAGCSIEAYNALEVEEGSPCLKMTSGGGTEVTFVSE